MESPHHPVEYFLCTGRGDSEMTKAGTGSFHYLQSIEASIGTTGLWQQMNAMVD